MVKAFDWWKSLYEGHCTIGKLCDEHYKQHRGACHVEGCEVCAENAR